MKLRLSTFVALGALALLPGCSSTPVKVNEGIKASTFQFVNRSNKPALENTDNSAQVHSMIQSAITKNLAGRGVQRVSSGGDVTVAYLVIVGNNVLTTSLSEYYGYSADLAALHDKAHDAYTGRGNPNHFEAGTLVIDIVDSKNFKLLKRGYATRPVLRDLSAANRAARIQEAVNQILQDVRISP